MKQTNKRYWISWWSKSDFPETVKLSYPAWITGYKNTMSDVPDKSFVAVIDAVDEPHAWKMVSEYFTDYEARFCMEKDPNFYPPVDRFP